MTNIPGAAPGSQGAKSELIGYKRTMSNAARRDAPPGISAWPVRRGPRSPTDCAEEWKRRSAPPSGQRHPPNRGPEDARGCTHRPAFHTSPHFLHRMYVTSGAVLALNTGSTAPHDGHAGGGGVVGLINRFQSERVSRPDWCSRAQRWRWRETALTERSEAMASIGRAGSDFNGEVRRTGAVSFTRK